MSARIRPGLQVMPKCNSQSNKNPNGSARVPYIHREATDNKEQTEKKNHSMDFALGLDQNKKCMEKIYTLMTCTGLYTAEGSGYRKWMGRYGRKIT